MAQSPLEGMDRQHRRGHGRRVIPALLIAGVIGAWISGCRRPTTTAPSPADQETGRTSGPSPEVLEQAITRCKASREEVSNLMTTLRLSERDLAAAKAERYAPTQAPPPPLDEAELARFRPEDRELDRQRHAEAMSAWEASDVPRRREWMAGHQARLSRHQSQLDRAARRLRELEPSLFTAPGSIEYDPDVAETIQSCDPPAIVARLAPPSGSDRQETTERQDESGSQELR